MTTHPALLTDRFGRQITYLRISITDRCDFRCLYCMGDDMRFVPRAQLLTLEEIVRTAEVFCSLGVNKIRITGGEPLVRHNVLWLFQALGRLPVELTLTTNGSQLEKFAQPLRDAGLRRINISLDSLRPDRFKQMTRHGKLDQVLRGIAAAQAAGFDRLKLNTVALKNYNDDEVYDLVDFAQEQGMDITFIEEMPLGMIQGRDRAVEHYPSEELRRHLEKRFTLVPSTENTGGPARYFRIPGGSGKVGFISPNSHNFCDTCNRVRITTEGRLLLCLGQEHSTDLRRVLRANPGDKEAVATAIRNAMHLKPKGHEFSLHESPMILRHMNVTGG